MLRHDTLQFSPLASAFKRGLVSGATTCFRGLVSAATRVSGHRYRGLVSGATRVSGHRYRGLVSVAEV